MAKKPLSPQEIDRRAGAISQQEYLARKEKRLRENLRYYRRAVNISLGSGLLFCLGRSGVYFRNRNELSEDGGFPWTFVIIVLILAFTNAAYMRYKQARAAKELTAWQDKLDARGRK